MDSLNAFLELANRDAALQERVVAASKQPGPVDALVSVAASAGFDLTAAQLEAVFAGELSDQQLDAVSGGYAFRAPGEWFAECYAVHLKTDTPGTDSSGETRAS